jgi:hypothetical protein
VSSLLECRVSNFEAGYQTNGLDPLPPMTDSKIIHRLEDGQCRFWFNCEHGNKFNLSDNKEQYHERDE